MMNIQSEFMDGNLRHYEENYDVSLSENELEKTFKKWTGYKPTAITRKMRFALKICYKLH